MTMIIGLKVKSDILHDPYFPLYMCHKIACGSQVPFKFWIGSFLQLFQQAVKFWYNTDLDASVFRHVSIISVRFVVGWAIFPICIG